MRSENRVYKQGDNCTICVDISVDKKYIYLILKSLNDDVLSAVFRKLHLEMRTFKRNFVYYVILLPFFLLACTQSDTSTLLKKQSQTIRDAFKKDTLAISHFNTELANIDSFPDIRSKDSLFRAYLLTHEHQYQPEKLLETISVYEQVFSESHVSKGFANEERAIVFLRTNKLDSAAYCVNKALAGYKNAGIQKDLARCYNVQAGIKGFQGKLDESFSSQFKALDIYKDLADSNGIFETVRELGNSCYSQRMYGRAKDLYLRSLRYYKTVNDSFMIADLYNTLGNTYHQLDMDKASEEAILLSMKYRVNLHDDFGLAESNGSLALLHMRKNEWSSGRDLLKNSIALFERIGDTRSINSMQYNLGVCEMELGNPKEAEKIFNEVIQFSEKSGIRDESLQRTLSRKISLMKKQGRLEEACASLEALSSLKDTLFSLERARTFEELNIQYDIQLKEEQMFNMQRENSSNAEKRLFLIIGLIIVILLGMGVVYLMIKRNQQARLLYAAENQIHQQQLDETQRELAFNRKQLEDFTFHLLEKNKIISELENKSLITKGEQENGEDADEFASLLQLKILTEEDWTRFKLYFDKAFPGLILKLRNEYPNLTGAEQRLFLLIKLKNDSREMSEMLGISMDSVRKNKYRLKKKLHLDEDLSLEDFIQIFK